MHVSTGNVCSGRGQGSQTKSKFSTSCGNWSLTCFVFMLLSGTYARPSRTFSISGGTHFDVCVILVSYNFLLQVKKVKISWSK